MKKLILSVITLFAFMLVANSSFGQTIEAQAKKAAKEAGCTGDFAGPLETVTTDLGTCECGENLICPYREVLVTRKANPQEAQYIEYVPFAKVRFCGNEMQSVECIVFY